MNKAESRFRHFLPLTFVIVSSVEFRISDFAPGRDDAIFSGKRTVAFYAGRHSARLAQW